MTTQPLLTVVSADEPDEIFEFGYDGQGRLFGRDDATCQIVIWSAINGKELSRIAGRIWRMDDELWIRNLSTRHELEIDVPGAPPLAPLAVRRDEPTDPGPARSIPGGCAFIRGPGGCELRVEQHRVNRTFLQPDDAAAPTARLPDVPEHLRATANALCAPLFCGGLLPAPYREIAQAVGGHSIKRARMNVTELLRFYEPVMPQLRDMHDRRVAQAERDIDAPTPPLLGPDGIRRFTRVNSDPDVRPLPRQQGLPDSYELAHLLVRFNLVGPSDISRSVG